MGTVYYVACKKCGVARDLDKAYNIHTHPIEDCRSVDWVKETKGREFHQALIMDFIARHMTHDIVFFTEHNEALCDEYIYLDLDTHEFGYKETVEDWWK